jgi:hypothetical protein
MPNPQPAPKQAPRSADPKKKEPPVTFRDWASI